MTWTFLIQRMTFAETNGRIPSSGSLRFTLSSLLTSETLFFPNKTEHRSFTARFHQTRCYLKKHIAGTPYAQLFSPTQKYDQV